MFRRLLRDSGVKPLLLPARSPNLNAFAERFVLSIKSECLERMVLLGEAHLQTAALHYLAHYHRERPHQGLRNEVLVAHEKVLPNGPVKRRQRLGGLLKFLPRSCVGGKKPPTEIWDTTPWESGR
jgi:transposase InsO family protein